MEKKISLEEKYLMLINGMIEAQQKYDFVTAEEYEKTYFQICEALAMKYMKSKGICEIPYFADVPEFKYNDQIKEYVNEDMNLQYNLEDLKKKYCI